MTAVEEVVQIPFFQGIPAEALREIAVQSTILSLEAGRTFISQHAAAEHVFFLISGSVQFYIHFHGVDDLLVGTMRQPGLCSAGRLFASRTATPRQCAAKRNADCYDFLAKR
jgi:CRP-like cAMP-binding protein